MQKGIEPALLVEIASLTFPGAAAPSLQDINIRIDSGEFVLVTGPTAGGKTVFCHCLAGAIPLFQPAVIEGRIEILGRATKDMSLPEMVQYLGFMQQDPKSQSFSVTVAEDVAFALGNLGRPPAEIRSRVQHALAKVKLTGYADRGPETLSGGEAQRAILAGILALDPPIMILDQPASEMDPASRQITWQVLAALHRRGRTIVMVENDIHDLLPLASRVLVMNNGKVTEDRRLRPPGNYIAVDNIAGTEAVSLESGLAACLSALAPSGLVSKQAVISLAEAPLRPLHHSGPRQGPDIIPTVKFVNCHYVYANGVTGLDGLDLEIRPAELTAIAGPNGSGKTTLVKHINGLLKPHDGKVFVNGQDTKRLKISSLAKDVGFLFQNPDYQIFSFSVLDEVSFGLKVRGRDKKDIADKAEQVLAQVGLWSYRQAHPYVLSRGQRQLLALASILIAEPSIIVADEPTTGLDQDQAGNVMQLLLSLRQEGKTVILISHNSELISRYAGRCIFMRAGKIQADLKGGEILAGFNRFFSSSVMGEEREGGGAIGSF